MGGTRDITLELTRIDDLFVGPEVDVAKVRLDPQPGMDILMDELRAKRLPERIRTTISLPDAEGVEGATAAQVQTLVDAYCRSNIKRNELQIAAIRREGLMELLPALLLLVATTLISLFIARTHPLSEEANQLAIAGLGILAWVGMWRPLGALLYDWWEPHRDNKIYRRLMEMDLTVLPG
jgi:hypothetical protein